MIRNLKLSAIALGVIVALLTIWNTLGAPLALSDKPPYASIARVSDASTMLREAVRDSAKDLRDIIMSDQIGSLSSRIFILRSNQCAAIKQRETILARTIGDQIMTWRREYRELTGREYDLRPCEEF